MSHSGAEWARPLWCMATSPAVSMLETQALETRVRLCHVFSKGRLFPPNPPCSPPTPHPPLPHPQTAKPPKGSPLLRRLLHAALQGAHLRVQLPALLAAHLAIPTGERTPAFGTWAAGARNGFNPKTYEDLWFPVVSCGFLWFLMVSCGFLWFLIVSFGFLWFPMVSYIFLWELPWFPMVSTQRPGMTLKP